MEALDQPTLILEIEKSREQLESTLDSVAETDSWDRVATGDWTVRDTLAVRTRWVEMLAGWIEAGLAGAVPETPAPGFKWNETPRLNERIVREEFASSPVDLRRRLDASLEAVAELIDRLDEDQLMLPEQFGWTRSWSVSRWISTNTITQFRSLRKMARKVLRERLA